MGDTAAALGGLRREVRLFELDGFDRLGGHLRYSSWTACLGIPPGIRYRCWP
ncbi:hypothetical protein RR42_m3465 [Cupriavidus basilensis]|uniref:Uncharacterized protein n=1 Tax=Cupriavidus basilensis TaxID=68895 RepID=A0A0C4YJF8_9BURK|nr:hypothetical protein RR42_m3465 [Cupriavidus basilensis]